MDASELPANYKYSTIKNEKDLKTFRVREIIDAESAKIWISEFSNLNFITWRVLKTYPNNKNYVFRKDYRCQHNTDRRALGVRSSKNSDCPAKLIVSINRWTDPEVDFPASISIVRQHNHSIVSPWHLKNRDLSDDTIKKLSDLFRQGHSPSSALYCLKTDLLFEHDDNYYKIAADGRFLPSLSKVSKLFEREFEKDYGNNKSVIGNLEEYFQNYHKSGGMGVFQKTSDEKNYFVVLLTPIMHRIHESINQASELVLLDACGGIDKQRHRLYALVTPTAAGGLPLGLIIADSETEKVFFEALTCLKDLLKEKGFFGKKFPKVIMTDNDMKERNAIKKVFPETTLLLCQFHLLKSMWSWLSNKKHNISSNDRQELYFYFKNIVYSYSEEIALKNVTILIEKAKELNYFNLVEHFQWLWEFKNDWVCVYRKDLVIRGNNTTNYVEILFRILKDIIFDRIMAYNLIQMVDYLTTRFEVYLKQRLVDFSNGRYNKSLLKRMYPLHVEKNYLIECKATGIFVVDNEFEVDLPRGICSCSRGKSGQLCIHASAVMLNIDNSYVSFNIFNNSTKALMLYVATGIKNSEWFKTAEVNEQSKENVEMASASQISSDSMISECPVSNPEMQTAKVNEPSKENVRMASASQISSDVISSDAMISECPVSTTEMHEFDHFINRIKSGIKTDPNVFAPAFKKMLSNIKKTASTDSGLLSAMHTFGIYTGVHSSSRKKAKQLIRRSHQTFMGVQPTAIKRRKFLLSGQKKVNSGRPASTVVLPPQLRAHDYTSFGVLPQRKRKAQHNLSQCVYDNKSLGK